MKFRYASDLHLEFSYDPDVGFLTSKSSQHDCLTKMRDYADFIIPPDGEDAESVLLLAGDICPGYRAHKQYEGFFDRLSRRFHKVLWIAGNHEYYGSRLADYYDKRVAENVSAKWDNVIFMQRTAVELPGVVVLGCTLWTDCDKGNPIATMAIGSTMNDYNQITFVDKERDIYRKLRVADTMAIHIQHSSWLIEQINYTREHSPVTDIVMMTHHAPSWQSISRRYLDSNDPINGAYASELLSKMQHLPDICIHGHLHDTVNYTYDRTVVMSNPYGYMGHRVNGQFNPTASFVKGK